MVFESVETGDEVVDDSTESNGDTKEVTVQKYEPVADDSISPNVKDVDGSTMPMDYDKSRSWYVFQEKKLEKVFRIIWMNLRMKITGTMKMTGKSRKDIPKKNLQRQSMTKNQK